MELEMSARSNLDRPGDELGQPNSNWDFEVFFDGECPMCKREIAMIRRQDRNNRIRFTDITEDSFAPKELGKTMNDLMAEIHGRLPNGEMVIGVDVFRHLYDAIGFHRLVRLTRLPGVSGVLDIMYRFFAKYRLKLAQNRCINGSCGT